MQYGRCTNIGNCSKADGGVILEIPEGAEFFASGGFETEAAAREAWQDRLGGGIEAGERYTHTFEVAGEYEYLCIPHETGGMVGTVVVEE